MGSGVESIEIAIGELAKVASKDAFVEYGNHSDNLVTELQVKLRELVSRWQDSVLVPENASIPYTISSIRYECKLGSCDGDEYHDESDLFWVSYKEIEDTEYAAGWYCMHCIENEFGVDSIDPIKGQLVTLATELSRRQEEKVNS